MTRAAPMPGYLDALRQVWRLAEALGPCEGDPPLRREAARYQAAAARDMRILDWLARRLGLPNLIPAFGLGVARVDIDLKTGCWAPLDGGRDAGFQVITLPILIDPQDRDTIIDILAFDAEDTARCWLRQGNADLLGEAALHRARYGAALHLHASPWAWLQGYGAALRAWWPERRSVEGECRAMAAQACIQMGRTGWEWLRWAEGNLRAWRAERQPPWPVPGLHGVCVLDQTLSYERLFAGVGALVGDGPGHAQWIAKKLNEDRRRRRLAESLPEVGFVAAKAAREAAA